MPGPNRTVRDGIIVGLIGTVTVAGFYAVFDFLAARGFLYTVNLLGQALLRGWRDPSILTTPVPVDTGVVMLYSALHVAVSIAIGLFVAWLVAHIDGPRPQARLAILMLGAGFLVTVFGIGMASSSFKALLPWWSVVLANALAVVIAGAYLLGRHPGLLRRLFSATVPAP